MLLPSDMPPPSLPAPRLRALATAVPPIELHQAEVTALGRKIFADRAAAFERMQSIYDNAGIDKRHSCVDLDWYTQPHNWQDRNALYVEHARRLMRQAIETCLEDAGLSPDDIDGIATVSTTGIATPSLDALLIEDMSFPRRIGRLPLFGLGCAGGVIGLNRVADIVRARPGEKWLMVVAELCGLTFRSGDMSKSNIVATALFGDGAAAMLIDGGECDGCPIGIGGEYTWPNSLDVMGWRMQNDGFGVLFSRDIPELVRKDLSSALDGFLFRAGIALSDIDEVVPHPGGAKVLSAIEATLNLPQGALRDAREVLREYGNMSAATVFFVLQRSLARNTGGRRLLSALGPGFTAGFALLEPGA
jgi:alkylresorcinol/alkylpyrone synthase